VLLSALLLHVVLVSVVGRSFVVARVRFLFRGCWWSVGCGTVSVVGCWLLVVGAVAGAVGVNCCYHVFFVIVVVVVVVVLVALVVVVVVVVMFAVAVAVVDVVVVTTAWLVGWLAGCLVG